MQFRVFTHLHRRSGDYNAYSMIINEFFYRVLSSKLKRSKEHYTCANASFSLGSLVCNKQKSLPIRKYKGNLKIFKHNQNPNFLC